MVEQRRQFIVISPEMERRELTVTIPSNLEEMLRMRKAETIMEKPVKHTQEEAEVRKRIFLSAIYVSFIASLFVIADKWVWPWLLTMKLSYRVGVGSFFILLGLWTAIYLTYVYWHFSRPNSYFFGETSTELKRKLYCLGSDQTFTILVFGGIFVLFIGAPTSFLAAVLVSTLGMPISLAIILMYAVAGIAGVITYNQLFGSGILF